jgi:ergothioneine biosynthesis protein EgtB
MAAMARGALAQTSIQSRNTGKDGTMTPPQIRPVESRAPGVLGEFQRVRARSVELAAGLSDADQTVQSMADASPTKWHLAHTTWFFETFVLAGSRADYRPFDARYAYLFNSYYEQAGPRHPRPRRGMITRPSAGEILDYRAHVDEAMAAAIERGDIDEAGQALIELGCHHEQQHQELLLTDLLHLFAQNPLRPAYRRGQPLPVSAPAALGWIDFDGGIVSIGHDKSTFSYDNERPVHDVLLQPFRLADRLVTNDEWVAFIADGGYRTATLWLADGWGWVQQEGIEAPLYWEDRDDEWWSMTLHGMQPVGADSPVVHVSFYEADAFARWSGKRLPTEFEWEHAVVDTPPATPRPDVLMTRPAEATGGLRQAFGQVWQWTNSAYLGYPGFRPPAGAVGEYNGKFMSGQFVLRGSSFATSAGHARSTYRNFFYPQQRWQFVGLRLADDA